MSVIIFFYNFHTTRGYCRSSRHINLQIKQILQLFCQKKIRSSTSTVEPQNLQLLDNVLKYSCYCLLWN